MVYLLHFNQRFKHAGHYLGFCADGGLDKRLERHRAGRGARLLEVVTAAGIGFQLARTWPGLSRDDERRMKGRGLAPLCPICSGSAGTGLPRSFT